MITYKGSVAGVPWLGRLVETEEDLPGFRVWVQRMVDAGQEVSCDTEAKGLKWATHGPDYLRLVQFGTKTDAWVIPFEHGPAFQEVVLETLRAVPALTGHNFIGFDGLVLDKHAAFSLEDLCAKTFDTLVSGKLMDPRDEKAGGVGHSLGAQSAEYVDPTCPKTSAALDALFKSLGYTKKSGLGWHYVPWNHPVYVVYAMLDVVIQSHLAEQHRAWLAHLQTGRELTDRLLPYEHELARMCAVMTRTGMRVDREYAETLYDTLEAEREKYAKQAARWGVANVNSNQQIIDALLEMGETLTELTDSGKSFKVDKAVLLPMADLTEKWERIGVRKPNPVAEAVLHAQRAGKWKTTYVDTFLQESDENGRIHPTINTLEARTGRMSITKPAVQTLPSGDWMIRRALLAEPGHVMISIDFEAVEMRVLAALADVRRMKQAINNNDDLHNFTATLVYGEEFTNAQRDNEDRAKYLRKICKGVGFGKVYGGGAATISRQTGAPIEDVRRAIAAYDNAYPEIKRKGSYWQNQAMSQKMVTISRTGRRLPLDRSRTYAVTNYQCQSAARDVLGQAMMRMDAAGLLPYMRLPVHDEILASVPADRAEELAKKFEECMTFALDGVPIDAEAEIGGRSWGSLYGADM